MSPEALEVLTHLQECKREREARLLRGAIVGTGIELAVAYKAAVAEIRLIDGLIENLDKVFNKKEIAEQAESGMTEMLEQE